MVECEFIFLFASLSFCKPGKFAMANIFDPSFSY